MIKLYKGSGNTQYNYIKTDFSVEEIFGGPLL